MLPENDAANSSLSSGSVINFATIAAVFSARPESRASALLSFTLAPLSATPIIPPSANLPLIVPFTIHEIILTALSAMPTIPPALSALTSAAVSQLVRGACPGQAAEPGGGSLS